MRHDRRSTVRASRRGAMERGALLALIAALVPLLVVGWFVLRGTRIGELPDADLDVPDPALTEMETDPLLGRAEGLSVQFMDRDDPTRLAGELISARIDPLEARRYLVEQPQAWIYLRDGRSVHIRADRGRLYIPDQETRQPESGTIEGNVVARIFAPRPDGSRPDPEKDEPLGRLDTPTLTFDMALGEVSMPEDVLIRSARAEASGHGLTVVWNQVLNRPERAEGLAGGRLTYWPEADRSDDGAGAPVADEGAQPGEHPIAQAPGQAPAGQARGGGPAGAARADAAPPEPPAPEAPPENYYSLTFVDEVVVASEGREGRGDRLVLWARLLGDRLPEGAIAEIRTAPAREPGGGAGLDGAGDGPAAAAPAAEVASARPTEGVESAGAARGQEGQEVAHAPEAQEPGTPEPMAAEPVTLTWSGVCTLRALPEAPAELANDHVALRFTAEKTGLVRFADADQGARGHCASLDYGATRRQLVMTGPGPASISFQTATQRFSAIRLALDLANGVGSIAGPHVLTEFLPAAEGARPLERQISATDQCDFILRLRDGALTGALQQVVFSGNVRTVDEDGRTLTGETLVARFEPTPREDNALSRLTVRGGAQADALVEGSLAADVLDVVFEPGADGRSEPRSVTAEGAVLAQRSGERIVCERLDATLQRDDEGDLAVVYAVARGGARFASRKDDVDAAADEIRAWPATEIVELIGEGAWIRRAGSTRVAASQMRLDGTAGRMEVFGAGTFEHAEERGGPTAVEVSWQRSMHFDDAEGIVECVGGAVATSTPDPLTRDEVRAERIRVELSPRPRSEAEGEPFDAGDREVRRALAFGAAHEGLGRGPAQVEARRYAAPTAPDAEPRLAQLLYLEGPVIVADNTAGTLVVDDPGQLVVHDARDPAPGAEASEDRRGTARFEWDGSMRMERATGTIDMRRFVRMRHRRTLDGLLTDLVAERLTAVVRERPGAGAPALEGGPVEGLAGELVSATASGAVHVQSDTRDLVADRLEYDALAGIITASAARGGVVQMFDDRTAAPVTAERLRWDLVNDRVEVEGAGPVVAPR